jgi:4-hydroxybenzoate polyprenyltransferase
MIVRVLKFLGERFGEHVIPIVLWMAAIDAVTRELSGGARPSPRMLVGFFTALMINACTRTTDEIKDVEVDREFYPTRPLVTGKVTVREVYGLTFVMVGLALAVNLVFRDVLVDVLIALACLFLMATWYGVPKVLSKNRVLAILSNCPVYFMVCFQQADLATKGTHAPAAVPFAVAALAMLPFLSYEFARKTFLPAGERAGYQSYSVLLGLRPATLVGFLLAALHFAVFIGLRTTFAAGAASILTTAGLALLLAVYGVFALLVLAGRRVPARALELSSGAYFVVGLVLLIAPTVISSVRS